MERDTMTRSDRRALADALATLARLDAGEVDAGGVVRTSADVSGVSDTSARARAEDVAGDVAEESVEGAAALRLLFSQLQEPEDADRFVDKVMAEAARRSAAERLRPSIQATTWRHVAIGLGSVAASVAVLVLPLGQPVVEAAAASAQWAVWLMTGGLGLASVGILANACADAWATSTALGTVLGRALTSPELALWLALSTGVGGGSVYGLVRVFSSEREVTSWVDPSSLA